ncbi:hypothetical protein Efla_004357 [Eimeria flavescens]
MCTHGAHRTSQGSDSAFSSVGRVVVACGWQRGGRPALALHLIKLVFLSDFLNTQTRGSAASCGPPCKASLEGGSALDQPLALEGFEASNPQRLLFCLLQKQPINLSAAVSWAEGEETSYPTPPGLDPDEDAAFRGKHQKGKSLWRRQYLVRMRKGHRTWMKIAPVFFYRRSCGRGPPSRQVILRVGQFDLEKILKDEKSQIGFLLHLRWMVEAYWRLIVPYYRLEPKLTFIVDLDGIGWRTTIANTLGITSLLKHVNAAFQSVTGKGMRKLFLLNPPSGFASIWSAAQSLISFRTEDVMVVKGEAERERLVEAIGEDCLWEGMGGKSTLPLGDSAVEAAFSLIGEVDEADARTGKGVRLTPDVEGFPSAAAIAELEKSLEAAASGLREQLKEKALSLE